METFARFAAAVVPALALAVALGGATGCEPPVPAPAAAPPTSVALFDPLGSPPVVPTPNDLAFAGGTTLNPPDAASESAAQRSLNTYLRRLNGFPASSTASAQFSAPLDPASVTLMSSTTAASVVLLDTTAGMLVTGATAGLSPDGRTLQVTPAMPFTAGHRYAVLLFGGGDPAGLRGADGARVVASPSFFFLRSPTPLVVRCGDAGNPDCACPPSALSDPSDTSCHSAVLGLADATARQAEPQRLMLQ
ncbi:MAG: hypothetical protein LC659_09150, partial [Myxococcales bacterium]|nr:hypothetical protein [Myxococcales bacterium]